MDRLTAMQDAFNKRAQPYTNFLQRGPVSIVLTLILVAYAGNFVPKISPEMQTIFNYVPFKIAYISLVVYLTGVNAGMAIFLGLAAYATFARIRGDNAVEAYLR